jgi:hypothetical protein
MSPVGPKPPIMDGQSMSALPSSSDVDLFCYGERVVDLYSQISNGTLDFCVTQ